MSKMFSGVPSFLGVLLFLMARIVIYMLISDMDIITKLFALAFMGLACLSVSLFVNVRLEEEVKGFE